MRDINNLIHLTLFWEVSAEFVAQSSNFTPSSSSHASLRSRDRHNLASVVVRHDATENFSARKYTFAKSPTAGCSGMSMNRNPCSPSDDFPAFSVASHPSPATLSLSLDHGSLDEGRSQLSNTRSTVRTVESLFA